MTRRPLATLALAGFAAATLTAGPALADPDTVTLDLAEFLALYDQSKAPDPDAPKPPVDHTVSDIRYAGRVEVDDDGNPTAAVFRATMRVDRLASEGWSRVRLVHTEASLLSATVGGREVAVQRQGAFYELVTDREGAFTVAVEFAVPITEAQGVTGLSFPMAPGGSNRVALTVPTDAPLTFEVSEARWVRDEATRDGRRVEAVVPAGARLAVSWQRPVVEERPGEEARASVQTEAYHLVGVGDGLLRTTAVIEHQIRFAPVDTFRYALPEGLTVVDVQGAGLRDWSLDGDGNLTVDLRFAAEDRYTLTVDLEAVIGEGDTAFDAPVVRPLDVDRSKGWVGVTASGNLEIDTGEVTGAGAVDVRTLPGAILGRTPQPVLLGYKYLSDDPEIPLTLTEHDEVDVLVILLDQARATTMLTADGRRLTQVRYDVRNNRRQFLRLALPPGAELWSAAVAGKAVQPARAGDGDVLLPLLRSADRSGALSSFEVEVVYVEEGTAPDRRGRGRFEAQLPSVDVPTTHVAWTVFTPEQARLNLRRAEGTLTVAEQPAAMPRAAEVLGLAREDDAVQSAARQTVAGGALDGGSAPVRVALPLEGRPVHFDKLLALDERLWVGFDYRGLR